MDVLPQRGGFKLNCVVRTGAGVKSSRVSNLLYVPMRRASRSTDGAACPESSIELRNRRSVCTLLVIDASSVTCFLVATFSVQLVLICKEANGIRGMLPDGRIITVGVDCVGRQIGCLRKSTRCRVVCCTTIFQEIDEHIAKEMTTSALPTMRSMRLLHIIKSTRCRVVCGTAIFQEIDEHIAKEMTASVLPTMRSRRLLHLRKSTRCRIVCGTAIFQEIDEHIAKEMTASALPTMRLRRLLHLRRSTRCHVVCGTTIFQEIDEHIAK